MPSSPSIGPLVFVRLLRLWAAAREAGENPLPHMLETIAPLAPVPDLGVACASLFELIEGQLGRRLVSECCCSPALSRDEQALLGVLCHAPEAGQPLTSAAVPHGLPGAICWAAFAVRRALGSSFGGLDPAVSEPTAAAVCPFNPNPHPVERAAPLRVLAV